MFSEIVREMRQDLKNIPSREKTLSNCIQNKLTYTEEMYKEQMDKAFEYICSRDNLKVIKTIARMKQEELPF